MRIGIGYDIHPLAPGRKLILGGVEIPHNKGLLGHSDADALIHSICDALLGAAASGDIGLLFPSDNEAYKDASSLGFLREVAQLVRHTGREIENIDSVIIAQNPRLSPFFDRMRETVAAAAGISVDRVNIKGKSPEGIGALGNEEAIAAYSVALLRDGPSD